MDSVITAFLLTTLAGLSTGIGSCIAFVAKHTNKKFLSVSLGSTCHWWKFLRRQRHRLRQRWGRGEETGALFWRFSEECW